MKKNIVTCLSVKDAKAIIKHAEQVLQDYSVGTPNRGDELAAAALKGARESHTTALVRPVVTLYRVMREAFAVAQGKSAGVGIILIGG